VKTEAEKRKKMALAMKTKAGVAKYRKLKAKKRNNIGVIV